MKKIKLNHFPRYFMFYICLIYILARPVLTNYVSEAFKYFFILIVGGCIGICVANRKYLGKIGKMDVVLYSLFSIFALLSALIAGGLELFILTFEHYVFFAFPIFLFPFLKDKFNWDIIVKFLIYFGILESVISFIEFSTQKKMFPIANSGNNMVLQYNGSIRTYGLNDSYFILGLILCIGGLAAYYHIKYKRNRKYYLHLILISVGILTTGSRGWYVSYAFGLLVLYLSDHDVGFTKKKLIKFLCIFVLTVFIICIILFSNLTTGISSIDLILLRIRNIFDWTNDSANTTRIMIWAESIKKWGRHFLFGNGTEITDLDYSYTLGVTESGLLKRLVELGLLGTILQYSTMLYPVCIGLRKSRKNRNPLVYYCIAVFVALSAEDFVLQFYTGIEFTVIIWWAIGFIRYHSINTENSERKH